MTVYGDLYFLLNGGVDYVLLLAAGRLGRARSGAWRLLLAAAAGAAYATAQLWAPDAWAFGPAGRVLASVGMVALAYAPLAARRFLALCVYLYAGAVFVAGATLAVSFAAASGWGGGISRWLGGGAGGGGRWAEIPWWALAASLGGALVLARALRARAARQPWLVGLQITVGGGVATCRGLVDTGNRLVDPLGSGPVVVVEAGVLARILPPALAAADDVEAAALALGGTEWERRLRLIPFRALGSDGGMLVAFRPDRVDIDPCPEAAAGAGRSAAGVARRAAAAAGPRAAGGCGPGAAVGGTGAAAAAGPRAAGGCGPGAAVGGTGAAAAAGPRAAGGCGPGAAVGGTGAAAAAGRRAAGGCGPGAAVGGTGAAAAAGPRAAGGRGPGAAVGGTGAAAAAGRRAAAGRGPGAAATVGITPKPLDPDGEYQALVPACLVAEGRGAAAGLRPWRGGVPGFRRAGASGAGQDLGEGSG